MFDVNTRKSIHSFETKRDVLRDARTSHLSKGYQSERCFWINYDSLTQRRVGTSPELLLALFLAVQELDIEFIFLPSYQRKTKYRLSLSTLRF